MNTVLLALAVGCVLPAGPSDDLSIEHTDDTAGKVEPGELTWCYYSGDWAVVWWWEEGEGASVWDRGWTVDFEQIPSPGGCRVTITTDRVTEFRILDPDFGETDELVVVWTSPEAGKVRISANTADPHGLILGGTFTGAGHIVAEVRYR